VLTQNLNKVEESGKEKTLKFDEKGAL